MEATQEQSPEKIDQVLALMTDKSRLPVLLHCHAGKDRTGMLRAYWIKDQGWSEEDVVQEMLVYGFDRGCCSNLEKSLKEWAAGLVAQPKK